MMNIFMGVLRKYKFNGIVTIKDYSKMSEQHKKFFFFKLLNEWVEEKSVLQSANNITLILIILNSSDKFKFSIGLWIIYEISKYDYSCLLLLLLTSYISPII